VVCGLVIDHIVDLALLFREMRRVCRPGGWVVVSVMHPAMMLRGVQARFHDATSGREIRPASQANQISDYILAAARAGFVFDHLSEHAVDESLANREQRADFDPSLAACSLHIRIVIKSRASLAAKATSPVELGWRGF
jgi:hypothetical protein